MRQFSSSSAAVAGPPDLRCGLRKYPSGLVGEEHVVDDAPRDRRRGSVARRDRYDTVWYEAEEEYWTGWSVRSTD